CEVSSNNNTNAMSSALPSVSSNSFSSPSSFVSNSLSLTNDFIVQTKTQFSSTSVPSSLTFSNNKSNIRNNNNNSNSNNPS
ncbi:unnamed protein product, partial [Rotaria socialis]